MMEQYLVFVKAATTRKEMDAVHQLTHDTFVKRGIIKPQPSGMLSNYPKLDKSERTVVFVAYLRGKIVGTISLTMSSHAKEVFNYEIFGEAIERTFVANEQCGSGWRLAVDMSDKLMQSLIILKLIESMHEYLFSTRVDATYFSFVTEHLTFYQKMFVGGELIDEQNLRTDVVNTDLLFMRYKPNFAVLISLKKRIRSMESLIAQRQSLIIAA